MKHIITIVLSTFITLSIYNCNTTEPGDDNGQGTTSHNFTFERWEFGAHSSSVLYDVAIIDENNIWAVGEIYLNDPTGESDPEAYNAVHWDGSGWQTLKIYYYGSCSAVKYPPLRAVRSFSIDNIILTNGGSIGFFDSNTLILDCRVNPFLKGRINKIWGLSKDDFYIVGDNGSIAHYNGSAWEKLIPPPGTEELDIYDIKGFKQGEEYMIYAAAAKHSVNQEKKILKIKGTKVTEVPITGLRASISGIWGKPGSIYYAVGGEMYKKQDIESNEPWISFQQGITKYYIYSIDGQETNDVVCSGSFGELLHYNGSTWKSYREEASVSADEFLSVKIKDDMIISVGYENPKAVIVMGKR